MYLRVVGLFTCHQFLTVFSYKHVVFMHGLMSGPSVFDFFVKQLKKDHPGTTTTQIDLFNLAYSMEPIWHQVYTIQIQFEKIMQQHPDGIHLVCYSQGGLICRGLLGVLQHNVDTFISLSCPLAGQYGDTILQKYLFLNVLKHNIYRFFYTDMGQKWSVANYWYDPHQQELYRKFSKFLAVLNNDTNNPESQKYKENFIRLKKMVLVGGPYDGLITPWQSGHFGMYNSSEVVKPMEEQRWYREDSFGLQTLNKRGSITRHTYKGVYHRSWVDNLAAYNKSVLPFLA